MLLVADLQMRCAERRLRQNVDILGDRGDGDQAGVVAGLATVGQLAERDFDPAAVGVFEEALRRCIGIGEIGGIDVLDVGVATGSGNDRSAARVRSRRNSPIVRWCPIVRLAQLPPEDGGLRGDLDRVAADDVDVGAQIGLGDEDVAAIAFGRPSEAPTGPVNEPCLPASPALAEASRKSWPIWVSTSGEDGPVANASMMMEMWSLRLRVRQGLFRC